MSIYEMIQEIPMFKYFSDKEKKIFANLKHSLVEFKKGNVIIKEGDQLAALYVLIKGTVLITRTSENAQIRLAKLKSGEIFGEMNFFSRKPRQSNVIANDDVLAMKMDDNFFEKITPEIKDKMKNCFIELLINRLEEMNESIMKISKLMRS
jgi:CRP-like cAMP-binding protein